MANLKYIGKNILNHDLELKKGNVSGSSTSTGSFGSLVVADKVQGALTVGGNLNVSQYIYHTDDANTYLNFTNDRLRFNIGGISYIDLNDAGSQPHDVTFNDGSNNVDFIIKGDTNNPLFKTDSSENRIGTHGKGTPEVAFHIGGSELRVDGNISGSSTGTGSFGTIQTTTGTIPTLLGDTTFNDNLTVTGNLDIADTIYHTGDSNTKIRFPEVDTISFHTSGDEKFRITSTGQLSGSVTSTGSFGNVRVTGLSQPDLFTLSQSIASRLTSEESEAEGSVISSSAQIATDISGSFTAPSASISTRLTTALNVSEACDSI